jgi:hypothetical protein
MTVAIAFFSVIAIAFPFTLDFAVTVPKLLFIPSEQGRVAFIALGMVIGTVILIIIPRIIQPTRITVFQVPWVSESRTAQSEQQRQNSYDRPHLAISFKKGAFRKFMEGNQSKDASLQRDLFGIVPGETRLIV